MFLLNRKLEPNNRKSSSCHHWLINHKWLLHLLIYFNYFCTFNVLKWNYNGIPFQHTHILQKTAIFWTDWGKKNTTMSLLFHSLTVKYYFILLVTLTSLIAGMFWENLQQNTFMQSTYKCQQMYWLGIRTYT